MFKFVVLATLLALASGATLPLEPVRGIGRPPIVGGDPSVISDAPWQVALLYSGRLNCGGSIISPTVILTAAHCTYRTSASQWTIRAGSNLHASGGDIYTVARVVNHEKYSYNSYDYDIAILILASPISIDNVNTSIVALPAQGQNVAAGSDALVTGWGATSHGGPYPAQLRKVTIPVVDQVACINAYGEKYPITPRMICGGLIGEGGKDACQLDSGGPFIVDGVIVGVTSWGIGCGFPEYPGVWARVPAFVDWIKSQM